MEPLYDGRVSLKIDQTIRGTWALPKHEMVGVGRLDEMGIHVPNSWAPSRLCRFIPYEMGWLVQLGRAQGRIDNKYLGAMVFPRRSVIALQAGRTLLSFPELDKQVRLVVVIGAGASDGHSVAQDGAAHVGAVRRTSYAVDRVELSPKQRRYAAVAFEHLLKRTAVPKNIVAVAAEKLGDSPGNVNMTLARIRNEVNKERWLNLETTDHLGTYLVLLSRNITWEDLPPELQ
ncbi:hypothetical protein [Nocardioides ochotonae]|uniref:hypothetical protein n=1 Tax=Nocardioides ochotonae TaxID=2685869 RepID=UPI0014072384|nr:hypothetical protein [Nocardioides ochotonae]